MGAGGGRPQFQGGSVGGVSDPALGQPAVAGGGASAPPINPMALPAGSAGPMMGMNAPTPTPQPQGPSALRQGLQKGAQLYQDWNKAGQEAAKNQPQPQQRPQPVNFNMPAQTYVPPPQMQNNPYAMSNAFYGG